jgi:hypothetical protein
VSGTLAPRRPRDDRGRAEAERQEEAADGRKRATEEAADEYGVPRGRRRAHPGLQKADAALKAGCKSYTRYVKTLVRVRVGLRFRGRFWAAKSLCPRNEKRTMHSTSR